MKDLATGEFHYSNLAVNQVEGDTELSTDTRRLLATILRSESFKITAVEAANNQYIAAGGDRGEIHILRSSGDPVRDLLGGEGQINSMHFLNDDSKIIAGTSFGLVFIWDLNSASDTYLHRISESIGPVNAVKFSPDGNVIAVGDSAGNILIYNSLMELQFTNSDHSNSITDLVFTSDGNHIVSVSTDGDIRVTKVNTGVNHHTHSGSLHSGSINSIDLVSITANSVTEDIIVTGGSDQNIRIASWDEGAFFTTQKLPGHTSGVTAVEFEKLTSNRRIFSCDGDRIKYWDFNSLTVSYSSVGDASDSEAFPKKLTLFGTLPFTCDGESKMVDSWLTTGLSQRIEIYKTIIQVVVWPDPNTFNIPQPSWPIGPIASSYPITCYAKRVAGTWEMNWEDDFKNLSSDDIQIRGYYTSGFTEGFLEEDSGDSME